MSTTYSFPSQLGSFIDGQWQSVGGTLLPVINPSTEEQIAQVVESDAQQVAVAVAAARRAHERGEWRRMPAAQRQQL